MQQGAEQQTAALTRRELRLAKTGPIPVQSIIDSQSAPPSRSRRRVTKSGGRLITKVAVAAATTVLLGCGGAAVAMTQSSANAETRAVAEQSEAVAVARDAQIQDEQDVERSAQLKQQATRYLRVEDDKRADDVAQADYLIKVASARLAETRDLLDESKRAPLVQAIDATKQAQKSGTVPDIAKARTALQEAIDELITQSYLLPQAMNGHMPESSMCPIPFSPSQRMRCEVVEHLVQLNTAFRKQFGYDLKIVSGYRPYANQAHLYATSGLASAPGRSNHGWGLAMDISRQTLTGYGTAQDTWLLANGPTFGFMRPDWAQPGGSMPEFWHWEYTRGVEMNKEHNGALF